MSGFQKAQRKQAKLKIALTGPSGSGKTYSGLAIATGLGKKIALIDTENCSASLYSDKFEFDVLELAPPYTIDKYRAAIRDAIKGGYEVLVVDSISHAWAGEGGLLEQKEQLDARGGNSYTNWGKITKQHEAFKSEILNADIHMICTMRSKQDYSVEKDDKGKTSIKKVGLAPVQRDGMEYEFTAVLDLAMDHSAEASKDRTGLFDRKIFTPTRETGVALSNWLAGGVAPTKTPEPAQETRRIKNYEDVVNAVKEREEAGWSNASTKGYMNLAYGVLLVKQLNPEQIDELVNTVKTKTYAGACADFHSSRPRAPVQTETHGTH